MLFFILGLVAVRLKSDLKIPESITTILSIYLLAAIGLHGGLEMRKAGLESIVVPILAAVGLAALTTLYHYKILRKLRFTISDSGALAATYGSVSVVTFSVGLAFLQTQGIQSEGYLAAILAVLEPTGIIVGVLLANIALLKSRVEKQRSVLQSASKGLPSTKAITTTMATTTTTTTVEAAPGQETVKTPDNATRSAIVVDKAGDTMLSEAIHGRTEGGDVQGSHQLPVEMNRIVKETLTGKAILVLLGSITIGYLIGENGFGSIKLVFEDAFRGALVIYLLEMGIIVGQRLGDVKKAGIRLVAFAVLVPTLNGIVGVIVATLLGLSVGGAMIFGLIIASASYIAAPAVLRNALPKANPSLYVTSALGLTFPYNVLVNLPVLFAVSLALHDPSGVMALFTGGADR